MPVTIKDIAKIAGVSHATVSRSLNDSPRVAQDTKERIKKIASAMDFQFNANARSLSTSRTGTIGIIYQEITDNSQMHFYFSYLQKQVRRSLEREDLDVIVAFSENSFTGENNIKKLITREKVDGLIISRAHINHKILKFMKDSKIPFVFFHQIPVEIDLEGIDAISTDHFLGGYLATEHLIKLGHRNILCISRVGGEEEFRLRTEGYKAALKDYNLPCSNDLILYSNRSFQGGYAMMKEKLAMLKTVTAIFVQTDLQALGVINALIEHGISVPNDVAVVGYDDIELATYFRPSITTIHQPREELAVLTCERLIELIKGPKPKKQKILLIKPSLVIRESCGGNKK